MAAVDITTIGIEYDTSGLEKGTRAQDKTRESANKMADSLGSAEKSTKSVTQATNYYTTALQAAAAAMGISKIIDQIDQYTKFTAQLKLATGSTAEYAASLNAVRQISKDAQSSLAGTGTLYAKIAMGTKELGVAQSQVAKITESINLSLKVSGATAGEAASAQLQLAQAFASGTLRGEEFNAVNEAAPRLMKALADGMGRPVGALKDMASNGLITSEIMANVLPKALEQLREEAKQVQTISGAFQVLKNNVMEFIGTQSQASGVVSVITGAIGLLADNLVILAGAIVTITATKFANFLSGLAVSAYESVAANRALAAANLATAQSNVAATASTLALADARVIELRQAVLAASGEAALAVTMNGLIPAQARATAASLAHTEALAAQTVAVGAASAGAGILRGALAFLGGPIGLIVTALGVAATAWSVFGDKAEEANDKTTKSTVESSQEVIARLDQEISKLKDRNKLRSENPELAKGSSEANLKALTQAQKDYNEALAGTGKAAGLNATAQAEMVKVLGQAYGQIYQRVNEVNSETKKLTEGTTSEKLKKWLGENGSAAQRMAAALAEAKKEVGVLTPEMEKLIKAKFVDKSIAKEAAFEESARHKMYLAHVKAEQSIQDQINKDAKQFASDQISRTKEVTKEIIAGINEQAKTYLAFNKSLDDHAQRMSDMNTLAQLEIDTLGMSSVQRNTLIEQKKIELALEKQLKDIRASNMAQGEKDILEEKAKTQANIDKSTAELRAQQGEWSKFYQDIYSGLTDSLYRGFEAGKGFFKSFWDGIKNLFKTTFLKLAVQGVVTGILGTGLAGTAAASNQLGTATNAFTTGKSLWDGFKAAGSIGGGISAGIGGSIAGFGNLVGSQSIAAFGSGLGMSTAAAGEAAALYTAAGNTAVAGGLTTGASINAALAAIPGWGWAALGAAAVAAAFGGGGDRVTGQQSISGTLGSNNISRDVPFTKSGGRLGKSDAGVWNYNLATSAAIASNGKSYVDTASQASDTAMLQQLNSNYAALQEAAKGYASILGLSADAVTAVSDRINFNLGKTKEETEAAMQAAFGQIANDITNRLSPAIASFSKEGEQVSATLARLAGSLVSVNQVMSTFGMKEFAQTLEGGNAAARLAELTGGIEKLASGAQYFFENFLTDAEKIKPSIDSVSEAMARLGQSSVDTIPEFKSLVQGLDLTTEAGAKMYAELIAIAPQFKAVADFSASASDSMSRFTAATDSAASPVARMVSEIDRLSAAAADAESAMLSERKTLQDQLDELTMTEVQLMEKKRNSYFEQNRDLFDSIKAAELNKKMQEELLMSEKNRIDSLSKEKSHLDSLVESSTNYVSATAGIMNGLAKNLEVIGRQSTEVFKDLKSEIEKILVGSTSGLGDTEKLAFAKSQLSTVSRDKLPEAVNTYLSLFKESAATQEIYTREFASVINFMSDITGEQKIAFDARIKAENDAATKAANEAAIGYAAFGQILADQEAARKKDAEITQVYLQPQSNLTNQQRVERQQWLVNNPMSTQTQADTETNLKTLELLKKLLEATEKTATATADMASGQAVITTTGA